MPTFNLTCHITVSAFTTVDAPTLKDAIALAEQRQVVIGGYGEEPEENWVINDADGEPTNIHHEK